MKYMLPEEIDRGLKNDEENLARKLREYKTAKASLRKARITSISNKLLAPFRRFRASLIIARYEVVLKRLEKEKERARRRAEKLQEKEQVAARKQSKEAFKDAIRDQRRENIENFFDDKKSRIIDFSKDVSFGINNALYNFKDYGSCKITSTSSFMISAKKSVIDKVKQSTTIDLAIKNAIAEFELNRARNKYNKAVEEHKKETVPFYNIKEKIQKARSSGSYMGKATNRVINYFKTKKEKLTDKVLETQYNLTLDAYTVMGKVSRAKSKLTIEFNNQIDKFKGRVNSLKESINGKIDNVKTSYENMKENIKNRRDEKNRDISIKRAQLESLRQATENINHTGNLTRNAHILDGGISR